jgi:hypothetical protein
MISPPKEVNCPDLQADNTLPVRAFNRPKTAALEEENAVSPRARVVPMTSRADIRLRG